MANLSDIVDLSAPSLAGKDPLATPVHLRISHVTDLNSVCRDDCLQSDLLEVSLCCSMHFIMRGEAHG